MTDRILVKIFLSENLINEIKHHIEGTSFHNISAFVEDLVSQKFPELQEPVYTKDEEKIIREHLRRLGYLE